MTSRKINRLSNSLWSKTRGIQTVAQATKTVYLMRMKTTLKRKIVMRVKVAKVFIFSHKSLLKIQPI